MQTLYSIKLLWGILSRTFAAYSSHRDFIKHIIRIDLTQSDKEYKISWIILQQQSRKRKLGGIMTKRREKKLLDRVRDAIRTKHYSIRTEEAYVNWIKRFILLPKSL